MNRRRWRLLGHGSGIALSTAVVAGVADALISRTPFVDSDFLWLAITIWVVGALPLVVLWSIFSCVFVAPSHDRGWRSPARIAGLQLAAPPVAVLWLGALVWVNINLFGSASEWPSLAADLALSFAAVAAVITLGFLSAKLYRRFGVKRSIAGGLLVAGACAVLVLTGALLSWPQPTDPGALPSTDISPHRTNVVLILIDTLRRDHLSVEGYNRATTPSIDHLANRGVRFERCMSQSSHTKPAVASLLTSSYLAGHGADGPRSVLADAHTTLVEAFRDADYRTGMFVANPVVSPAQGYAQGAERFWGLTVLLSHRTMLGHALIKLSDQPLVSDPANKVLGAVESIERAMLGSVGSEVLMTSAPDVAAAFYLWRTQIDDDPYFAYLHFGEPHAPYRPPPDIASRFSSPSEPFVSDHPALSGRLLPFSPSPELPAPRRSGMIRAYDGEIFHVDSVVGDIVAQIDVLDGLGNTIVVVTSDHGEEFYEHRSWGHGQSLYRELIEVPLVMSGSDLPTGLVVPQLVELIDIAPTLLTAAGLSIPATMYGRSLLPLLNPEGVEKGPRQAIAEVQHRTNCWARCLIEDPYKLVVAHQNGYDQVELFDLSSDPDEHHDLASERPQLVARLRADLETRLGAASQNRFETPESELDSTTEERLRALGYLD